MPILPRSPFASLVGISIVLSVSLIGLISRAAETRSANSSAGQATLPSTPAAFFESYCYECHDSGTKKGGLVLDNLDPKNPGAQAETWEKVFRKLDHRQMPPLGEDRPSDAAYRQITTQLATNLDRAAAAKPNPGRTDTFR